jgi:hypothetical protein
MPINFDHINNDISSEDGSSPTLGQEILNPVGTIRQFANEVNPTNRWLPTGAEYSKTTYPDLATMFPDAPKPGPAVAPAAAVPGLSFIPTTPVQHSPLTATNGSIIVAIAGSSRIMSSTDGSTWTPRASKSVAGALHCIYYLNNLFLIGGANGTIITSPDGINWTVRTRELFATQVSKMAYGAGIWVAIGGTGLCMTSSDGVTWIPRNTGSDSDLYGLAFGNSIFVMGDNGQRYFSSTDGITWTLRASGATYGSTRNIIWDTTNSIFVSVGVGGKINTSSNGTAWTNQTSNVAQDLQTIAFNGGLFVAAGSAVLATSPTGVTWTSRTITMPAGKAIVCQGYLGTTYYIGMNGAGIYATSPDGATWTTTNDIGGTAFYWMTTFNSRLFAVGADYTVLLAGATRAEVLQGVNTTIAQPAVSGTANAQTFAFGAGIYVAACGSGLIMTSTDGVDWAVRTVGTAFSSFNCVIFANSLFVLAGVSGQLYTSPDGINWTVRTSNTASTISNLAYGNGAYVAVAGSGNIVSSPDGVTWTSRTSNAGANAINSVVYANSLFVAVADAGVIVTSPDGTTWTARTSNTATSLNYLTYANSLFVAIATGSGTNMCTTSPDGTTWTLQTGIAFGSARQPTYASGVWSVVGGTGNRAFSTDAATWFKATGTTPAIPAGQATDGTTHVVAGSAGISSSNGRYWVARSAGAGNSSVANIGVVQYLNSTWLYTTSTGGIIGMSSDGINWRVFRQRRKPLENIRGIFSVNGNYLLIGANGYIASSTNGTTWTKRESFTYANLQCAAYGAGVYVVGGQVATLLSSTDMSTWTPRSFMGNYSAAAPYFVQKILYAGGKFVALLNGASTVNSVIESADGITWSEPLYLYSSLSASITDILYFNSRWIAFGQLILTSTDAITWDIRSAGVQQGTGSYLCSASGNGIALLMGTTGSIALSVDGINWVAGQQFTTDTFVSVTFHNNYFYAVTANGGLFTSADGLSWESHFVNLPTMPTINQGNPPYFTTVRTSDSTLLIPNLQGSTTSTGYFPSPVIEVPTHNYDTVNNFHVPKQQGPATWVRCDNVPL